jgi:ankyrin repeat protein
MPAVAAMALLQTALAATAQDEVMNLLSAIQQRHDSEAMAMLERNTNLVGSPRYVGASPLLEAAAVGNAKLVKRLLELKADPNIQGDTLLSAGSQNTALHLAVRGNHVEVGRLLLEAGADPNRMAFGYVTPLHLAFKENREEMAGLLLDYGAEPFQGKLYSNDATTPFEVAITDSNGRLVPRMLGQDAQHPLRAKSIQKSGSSKPRRRGLRTSAEVLREHGVELFTAAAQRGELEAVLALLHAGVNSKDANTNCPTLLQGYSLASLDAARNLPSISNQLHQVQDQLKAGYIPQADPAFVASLRAQEATLAAKLDQMSPERWRKVFEALVEHGAVYDAFAATALGDLNQARRLLSADPHASRARDCKGQTPLHWAIQTDRPPMVEFWMAGGTSLNATNCAGQTALHLAASAGKADFVKALLAARASTSIRDTNNWTPVDAAIQAKQSDCIHLLLPEQASGSHTERGLSTILHQAAASGNVAGLAAVLEGKTNLEALN